MRVPPRSLATCPLLLAPLGLLALTTCGGGGGGGGGGGPPPPPTIVSVSGPLPAAVGGPFTVTGANFPGVAGTPIAVRFEATDGLPFGTCGSTTIDLAGTLDGPTSVSGVLLPFVLTRDVLAHVRLGFASTFTISASPIASFLGTLDPTLDHDLDGVPDVCDPHTYDFEADTVGARPAAATALDGNPALFSVRDVAGDHAAAHAIGTEVPYDRLDRLRADHSRQDVDLYLDLETGAAHFDVELWSEGSFRGNAGAGLIFQVRADGTTWFYERVWASILSIAAGPPLPASGRVRLRVRKGAGETSSVHLDVWNGASFALDAAVWPLANDRAYRGLDVATCSYAGGGATRGLRRATAVHAIPAAALTLGTSFATSSDHALFPRDATGHATVPVRALCRATQPARLEARVVASNTAATLGGHDWSDHAFAVPARASGVRVDLPVTGVPTGGNYDVQVRLVAEAGGAVLGQQVVRDVAVGDVWVAAGQSNMSGYAPTTGGATVPIPEVHLFGNDGRWKEAREPMDDGTDQTDAVSYETPSVSCMLAFGRELFERTGVPVAIVPTPLGGTTLYAQWQRNAAFPAARATLYGSMLHRARLAAPTAPPRGLLWFQGESDAFAGRTRAQYLADLEAFAANVRGDLGAPGLVFACGQLGTYVAGDLPTWLPVQEAQREAAAADPLMALAPAVDLAHPDGIHFDVAGYTALGRRFATAARRLAFGEALDETADLLSATAGGDGASVVLTFESAVTGGSAALFRVTDASGDAPVTDVSVGGATVTLALARALDAAPRVSYGWSVDPAAPWLRDAAGVPAPVFHDVPVGP